MKKLLFVMLAMLGARISAGQTNYQYVLYDPETEVVQWSPTASNPVDEVQGSTDINLGFMRLTNSLTVTLGTQSVAAVVSDYWDDGGVSEGFAFETDRLRWTRSYDLPAIVDLQGRLAPAVGSNKDISLYISTNGTIITEATLTQTATSGDPLQFIVVFPITFASNVYLQIEVSFDNSPVKDVDIEPGMTVKITR